MQIPDWVAPLFGTGGFGVMLAKAIADWWSGRAQDEKDRNKSALAEIQAYNDRMAVEAVANDARADDEAKQRRITQEYASKLRRILSEHGVEPPPWPDGLDP